MEYAAHTRDIVSLHAFGVEQALTVDEPTYPEFAASALDDAAAGYGAEHPNAVVAELGNQATRRADIAAGAGAGSRLFTTSTTWSVASPNCARAEPAVARSASRPVVPNLHRVDHGEDGATRQRVDP